MLDRLLPQEKRRTYPDPALREISTYDTLRDTSLSFHLFGNPMPSLLLGPLEWPALWPNRLLSRNQSG